MGYAVEDSKVRLDRFKQSGKWYDSYSLDMQGFWDVGPTPHDAVQAAMDKQGIRGIEGGFVIVLEPYHKHSYPVVIFAGLTHGPT